jgi:hypothetical protein
VARLFLAVVLVVVLGCSKPEGPAPEPAPEAKPLAPQPLALPISKADVVSALATKAFTLAPDDAEKAGPGEEAYLVVGSSARVVFRPIGDRLDSVVVVMEKRGTRNEGAAGVHAAATILEAVSGSTPAEARQAIGRTITVLGGQATNPQRFVGLETPKAIARATRDAAGNITLVIEPIRR